MILFSGFIFSVFAQPSDAEQDSCREELFSGPNADDWNLLSLEGVSSRVRRGGYAMNAGSFRAGGYGQLCIRCRDAEDRDDSDPQKSMIGCMANDLSDRGKTMRSLGSQLGYILNHGRPGGRMSINGIRRASGNIVGLPTLDGDEAIAMRQTVRSVCMSRYYQDTGTSRFQPRELVMGDAAEVEQCVAAVACSYGTGIPGTPTPEDPRSVWEGFVNGVDVSRRASPVLPLSATTAGRANLNMLQNCVGEMINGQNLDRQGNVCVTGSDGCRRYRGAAQMFTAAANRRMALASQLGEMENPPNARGSEGEESPGGCDPNDPNSRCGNYQTITTDAERNAATRVARRQYANVTGREGSSRSDAHEDGNLLESSVLRSLVRDHYVDDTGDRVECSLDDDDEAAYRGEAGLAFARLFCGPNTSDDTLRAVAAVAAENRAELRLAFMQKVRQEYVNSMSHTYRSVTGHAIRGNTEGEASGGTSLESACQAADSPIDTETVPNDAQVEFHRQQANAPRIYNEIKDRIRNIAATLFRYNYRWDPVRGRNVRRSRANDRYRVHAERQREQLHEYLRDNPGARAMFGELFDGDDVRGLLSGRDIPINTLETYQQDMSDAFRSINRRQVMRRAVNNHQANLDRLGASVLDQACNAHEVPLRVLLQNQGLVNNVLRRNPELYATARCLGVDIEASSIISSAADTVACLSAYAGAGVATAASGGLAAGTVMLAATVACPGRHLAHSLHDVHAREQLRTSIGMCRNQVGRLRIDGIKIEEVCSQEFAEDVQTMVETAEARLTGDAVGLLLAIGLGGSAVRSATLARGALGSSARVLTSLRTNPRAVASILKDLVKGIFHHPSHGIHHGTVEFLQEQLGVIVGNRGSLILREVETLRGANEITDEEYRAIAEILNTDDGSSTSDETF